MARPRLVSTLICGGALGWASHVDATYSIAAVDQGSQQVGGAITSCVGELDVGVVYGSAPGFGVVHAQALLDQRGRAKARVVELLMQQVPPAEAITEITALSFDAAAASRQYGIVDLQGRAAGFTGTQAQDYKHDQQGGAGAFFYSVQGNILTSQKVLDQAAAAFEGQGCDLAERLMLALEAGAQGGEGDSRCTDQGIPSDSAFIEVDRPGEPAGTYLKLSVSGTAPESPLVLLRAQFDQWRATHPCQASEGDSGGAGAAAAGTAGTQGTAGVAGSGVDTGSGLGGQGGAAETSAAGAAVAQTAAAGALAPAGASGTLAAQSGSGGAARAPAAGEAAVGEAGAEMPGHSLMPTAGTGDSVASTLPPTSMSTSAVASIESGAAEPTDSCACSLPGRAPSRQPQAPGLIVLAAIVSVSRARARARARARLPEARSIRHARSC